MAPSAAADKRAREAAATWFARLNQRAVSLESLEAFRLWRQDPRNRLAYEAVEGAWRDAETLARDPEIGAALTAAMAGPARRGSDPWVWPAAAAAGLAVLVVGAFVLMGGGSTYATRVGEQRLVRLDDGTAMRLDTDTQVQVAFRGAERDVRLAHGQAFFDVAHDPSRPFIVDAGALRVRAVGTRFDVRREGADARVTLVQGIVQVRGTGAAAGAWTLTPGEQVRLGRTTAPIQADVAAATSWTSGRVVFQGAPLAQAIDEINRYSPHKIRLDAPAVASVPVTGSFQTGDVDAFIAAVSDLHGLRAQPQADGTIALQANASQDAPSKIFHNPPG